MSYTGQTGSLSGKAPGAWGGSLPGDHEQAMLVLDALSGGRTATNAFRSGTGLPGAELAGPQPERIQLAQANTGTMSDGGPGWGGLMGPAGRVLRGGNALLSASQALQEIRRAAERAQVESALSRFGLNRNSVADVYAARAYVWSKNFAGSTYWDVPYSGPINERVAVAIMRHERDNPGTLGLMTNGDGRARAAIDAIVAAAVAGTSLAGPVVLERRKSIVADPELSTDSRIARGILRITGNQSWIAHHLIPFAVVANLPNSLQLAMAAAHWTMDSAENLIALPKNQATYLGPTNVPRHPWHAGSHPRYSADVAARVGPLAGTTGNALRRALLAIELHFRQELVANIARYHQMLR